MIYSRHERLIPVSMEEKTPQSKNKEKMKTKDKPSSIQPPSHVLKL